MTVACASMTDEAMTAAMPSSIWPQHLAALGLACVAVVAFFIRDWLDMADMWWNVSTYGHCLFILPIIVWLVHQRRDEVAAFAPQAWWPGLIAVFGAGCLWMLGEAGGIGLFRHAGVVAMVQALILTILGPVVTRALLFPTFYLVFLVPAGEELVPMLQTITAKLTIALMGISNIPHVVNGVLITIPGGYFEVAEECSGVMFLIAMVAYGMLVANICFKSWVRRGLFMAMCIVVPILANGFRAFATIWAAWAVDRDFAKGFDHIVYGWFFFAIVIVLVMAMGWRFFDRSVNAPWLSDMTPGAASRGANPVFVGGAAIAAFLAPMAWQSAVAASGRVPMPQAIALPAVRGWERVSLVQHYPWTPRFHGADHRLHGAYRRAGGATVELALAVYAWQEERRELVGYGQGALDPDSQWAWARKTAKPRIGRAERITAPGPVNREVVHVYWVNGKIMGAPTEVKLETLKTRLLGGDQAALAVLISAEEPHGRAAVDQFMADMGGVDVMAQTVVSNARGR